MLIDTSGSMHGAHVRVVEQGLHALAESLRTDPAELDTVVVSLISFDSSARQLVPLTRVARLSFPPLHACGTTALGEALKLLAQCISREAIAEPREGQRRDSKPLVFVMTDGMPMASWQAAADSLQRRFHALFIGCALGDAADVGLLRRMTRAVVSLSGTDDRSIAATFDWVAARAGVVAASIEAGQADGIKLPPLPPNP